MVAELSSHMNFWSISDQWSLATEIVMCTFYSFWMLNWKFILTFVLSHDHGFLVVLNSSFNFVIFGWYYKIVKRTQNIMFKFIMITIFYFLFLLSKIIIIIISRHTHTHKHTHKLLKKKKMKQNRNMNKILPFCWLLICLIWWTLNWLFQFETFCK